MTSATYSYRGLFLLHFEPRYRHAGHYLGYAKRDLRRYARDVIAGRVFAPHPLVECAILSGADITVADVYPGGDRALRSLLRRRGSLARICPICKRLEAEALAELGAPP